MTPIDSIRFSAALLYQSWTDRMTANPGYSIADLRSMFDEWHQPTQEPEGVAYKSEVLAGVECIWALPADADNTKVLLYTHGGGFAVGSASSHRKLAGHLAKHLGVTALVIDYRRAPEHPFPAQIEDSTAVYRELLARGFRPENITTSGDSAGGNLAIATVLKLRDDGVALPGAVIAFSPWLDMEQVGRTLDSNQGDRCLGQQGNPGGDVGNVPRRARLAHRPSGQSTQGQLQELPTSVRQCRLEGNAARQRRGSGREIARGAGVDVTLSVVEGMQHVFPCLAGRAREADEELSRIARWFKAA